MDRLDKRSLEDVTVVVRSSYERTESSCINLIREQGIESHQIEVIHKVPFEKALQASLTAGIDHARPWTYCIDADVLLAADSIAKMMIVAQTIPSQACEIQGRAIDKFVGTARHCGNHLYATAHLDKALQQIPEIGTTLRPEHAMLKQMDSAGLPWFNIPLIIGLHDFEQSYADIFRTARLYSRKREGQHRSLVHRWRQLADDDFDFAVALAGYAEGIGYPGQIAADSSDGASALSKWYPDIEEKDPFEEMALSDVQSIMDVMLPVGLDDPQFSPSYSIARIANQDRSAKGFGGLRGWRNGVRKFGMFGGMFVVLGRFSNRVGDWLYKRGSQRCHE